MTYVMAQYRVRECVGDSVLVFCESPMGVDRKANNGGQDVASNASNETGQRYIGLAR